MFFDEATDRADFAEVSVTDLKYSVAYQLGGREWRFDFQATTQFTDTQRSGESWLIGISGLLISILLALVLHLVTGRNKVIEQLVEKRTEELAQATEALKQSNIELQQFAFIASHDLQTPFRGVMGFAEILQQDYQGKLDGKAKHYLDRIVDGTKRMQALIKNLLTYSRVDSRSHPFEATSLNDAFDSAVLLLSSSIEDSAGKVTHDDLPTVVGDGTQLSQLMLNLIANGIKYQGDQPPRVHVSAEKRNQQWTSQCVITGLVSILSTTNRFLKRFTVCTLSNSILARVLGWRFVGVLSNAMALVFG